MSEPAGEEHGFPRRGRVERELLLGGFLALFTSALLGLVDPDLPGHISYGMAHLAAGHLPATDPYAYSVVQAPWYNHEWLFELLVGWLFQTFGHRAVALLQLLVWSATGGLVLWEIRRRTRRDFMPTALIFLAVVMLSMSAITVRPQMFTYLFFTAMLLLLERARRGQAWAWAAAGLLFLPWVNLHGGFLAGLGVFGVYGLGLTVDTALGRSGLPEPDADPPAWKNVGFGLAGGVLGSALTLINPAGTELYHFLSQSLGRARPMISEWLPLELNLHGVVYVGLILAVAAALGRTWRRVPLAHVLVLGITAWLGVRHVRHLPFFALSVAVFAPAPLAQLYRSRVRAPSADLSESRGRRLQWAVRLIVSVALVAALANDTKGVLSLRIRPDGISPFPTGACEFIEAHDVRGNLLVKFDWAQLMIGRYHPRLRVFFDGRFRTVYPPQVENDYFSFRAAQQGWRRALDDYPTELVLLHTHTAGAVAKLEQDPGWVEVYRDSMSVLFVRADLPWAQRAPVMREDPLPVLPFELAAPVAAATSAR